MSFFFFQQQIVQLIKRAWRPTLKVLFHTCMCYTNLWDGLISGILVRN